jgi:hypothetical protein
MSIQRIDVGLGAAFERERGAVGEAHGRVGTGDHAAAIDDGTVHYAVRQRAGPGAQERARADHECHDERGRSRGRQHRAPAFQLHDFVADARKAGFFTAHSVPGKAATGEAR